MMNEEVKAGGKKFGAVFEMGADGLPMLKRSGQPSDPKFYELLAKGDMDDVEAYLELSEAQQHGRRAATLGSGFLAIRAVSARVLCRKGLRGNGVYFR